MATSHDLDSLEALDFAAEFACDSGDHGDTPRRAVWRVRKIHAAEDCAPVEHLLCDDHVKALEKIGNTLVVCFHCNAMAPAARWFRIVGGI